MKSLQIALVAHDGRKEELLTWVKYNAALLSKLLLSDKTIAGSASV